jgi:dTDP-4-dehydrorhamnose 3,5-epimerase
MMEKAHFIENRVFRDKRGTFSPLDLAKLDKNWLQSNISVNPRKYTLRGLHFQKNEYAQAKLIKVISGKILDFVVDLRMVSEDYNKVFFFEMSEGDEVYVPRYFAHGFITLVEDCVVQYLVDNDYSPENEGVKVWTDYPEIIKEVQKYNEWFVEEFVQIADKDLVEK